MWPCGRWEQNTASTTGKHIVTALAFIQSHMFFETNNNYLIFPMTSRFIQSLSSVSISFYCSRCTKDEAVWSLASLCFVRAHESKMWEVQPLEWNEAMGSQSHPQACIGTEPRLCQFKSTMLKAQKVECPGSKPEVGCECPGLFQDILLCIKLYRAYTWNVLDVLIVSWLFSRMFLWLRRAILMCTMRRRQLTFRRL